MGEENTGGTVGGPVPHLLGLVPAAPGVALLRPTAGLGRPLDVAATVSAASTPRPPPPRPPSRRDGRAGRRPYGRCGPGRSGARSGTGGRRASGPYGTASSARAPSAATTLTTSVPVGGDDLGGQRPVASGEPVQPTRQAVDVDLDHASGGGHAGEATGAGRRAIAGPWGSGRVCRVTVQVPPAGYQRLEAARVLATIERLQRRIAARFPERGLCRVAGELVTVAAQVADSASSSRLRLRRIRVLSRVLSVVILVADPPGAAAGAGRRPHQRPGALVRVAAADRDDDQRHRLRRHRGLLHLRPAEPVGTQLSARGSSIDSGHSRTSSTCTS